MGRETLTLRPVPPMVGRIVRARAEGGGKEANRKRARVARRIFNLQFLIFNWFLNLDYIDRI
mgnify:CR=1 FL=1